MAKKRHHASKKARMHEHMGMETYERGPVKHHRKYDSLSHHAPMHNDEHHHDSMKESAGPYYYDRQKMSKNEFYAGQSSRRHQEMKDAGMIHEDHHAIANLPQQVMIKSYPRPSDYLPEDLNDTLVGVDRQRGYDHSQMMRNYFPKKV